MLSGKVAIVTGAGTGIGKEVAKLFGKNHASVVVNYRSSEKEANEVKKEIEAMGAKAITVKADISNYEDCKKILNETLNAFGHVDILVNNSGMGLSKGNILDITNEEYHRVMKTNIDGTYYMTTLVLKQMEDQGKGGSIVSISSSAVAQPSSGNGPYAMSKAAVELLMRSIAQNHGEHGIRCNIVAPGPTETNMVKEFFNEEKRQRVTKEIPLRRFGDPKETAQAVLFFASDMSSYVTGQKIHVDGGRTIR